MIGSGKHIFWDARILDFVPGLSKFGNSTPLNLMVIFLRGLTWTKELANHPFKETAEHFNRDPVVISKGIKGLEKKIREDETISTAITMLQESLTKNRKKILI